MIQDVASGYESSKVVYFGYSRAGKGTPGHLRYRENDEMANELTAFIEGLPNVWRTS
jgi:hypothetical protein